VNQPEQQTHAKEDDNKYEIKPKWWCILAIFSAKRFAQGCHISPRVSHIVQSHLRSLKIASISEHASYEIRGQK
jgi:hypothetical protein